jgi:spore germination cell wall hydrolase CwlJ-like protein
MLDKALESYDTGKFTGKNPAAEKKAMDRAIKAAKAALNGENNIGDYLCFRMNNSGAKSIKKKYSDYKILGAHIFYRTK